MNSIQELLLPSPHQDKIPVKQIVLATIALTGLVAVAAIAPNALRTLKLFGWGKRKYGKSQYIDATIERMIRRGLIVLTTNKRGIKCVRLTPPGRAELNKYQLQKFQLRRPRRWDGKYRAIIFDIKEWKRTQRDELRRWLERLGFVKLQNSVWVYPYECQEVVVLLKSFFHLGQEVLYLVIDSIENDRWLRRKFNL